MNPFTRREDDPVTLLEGTRHRGVDGRGAAFAQLTLRGNISRIVTDSTSALVPDAKVALFGPGRNQNLTPHSNASGLYSFTKLTAGSYQVAAEHAGFKITKSPALQLTTGQAL